MTASVLTPVQLVSRVDGAERRPAPAGACGKARARAGDSPPPPWTGYAGNLEQARDPWLVGSIVLAREMLRHRYRKGGSPCVPSPSVSCSRSRSPDVRR